MKNDHTINPNKIDEHKHNEMRPFEGIYDYAKRMGIDTEKIDAAAKISSDPALTTKPYISYAEFSEMRSKYYTLENQYNKLKKDYELLVEANERMKPNSKNHHMILDVHPYCDKCLRFKPIVKKYIDIHEETIEYENGFMEPEYDSREIIKGNTVVSCEHHDTCSIMYDYIYEHLKKK